MAKSTTTRRGKAAAARQANSTPTDSDQQQPAESQAKPRRARRQPSMLEQQAQAAPAPAEKAAPVGDAGRAGGKVNKHGLPALRLGSDVEMARGLAEKLKRGCDGQLVSDSGTLYRWAGTHYEPIDAFDVRRECYGYDGEPYEWTARGPKVIKLDRKRIDSILFELGAILHVKSHGKRGYFGADDAPVGVNLANGFLRILPDGSVSLEKHSPEHRQLHVLPGSWEPREYDGCSDYSLPHDSLLNRLLDGSFRDDEDKEEKAALLQEVAGVALARHAARLEKAKFILLHGPGANNGKSQVLDMLKGMFPPDVVAAISPEDWGQDTKAVALRYTVLNAVPELSGSVIKSSRFKTIVSGEMISARDVYESTAHFHPLALHIAGTNKSPLFEGGIDQGVMARMVTIPFLRSIPEGERVRNIGQRIAKEESSLLIQWAVEGAQRAVARGSYEIPASCHALLHSWSQGADPVRGFMAERVDVNPKVHTRPVAATDLFAAFQNWAEAEGYDLRRIPQRREFLDRVRAFPGVADKRTADIRGVVGLKLITGGRAPDPKPDPEPEKPKPFPRHRNADWHAEGPEDRRPITVGNAAVAVAERHHHAPPITGDAVDEEIPF